MRHLCALILPLLFLTPAHGQEQQQQQPSRPRIWTADFGDTAKITVDLRSIVSVSIHPYMLNGAVQVTEVTIDTTGNNSIRFYYIHADDSITATETSPQGIISSAGQKIQREITQQKNESGLPAVKFPEGAYAHTIEYQVNSLDDLLSLYKSVISVWNPSGGRTYKPRSQR